MKLHRKSLFLTLILLLSAGMMSVSADTRWQVKEDTTQSAKASWTNMIKRVGGLTPDQAKRIAEEDPRITYFFYTKHYTMTIVGKGIFEMGDVVFFSGEPSPVSAPNLADMYIKAGNRGNNSDDRRTEPDDGRNTPPTPPRPPVPPRPNPTPPPTPDRDNRPADNGSYGQPVHLGDNDFYSTVAGKLVFVDFYADWCGPCRAFAPVFEEVASIINTHMFVKVDVDSNGRLSGDFGIRYIPHIVALYDGEVVEEFSGSRTAQGFSSWCSGMIGRY